jgi:hypothetical protein
MTANRDRRAPPPACQRQAGPWQAALLVVLGLAACSTAVTSTLDGHATLPHRIQWQAFPRRPSVDISEVDHIHGKQVGVELDTNLAGRASQPPTPVARHIAKRGSIANASAFDAVIDRSANNR